MIAAPPPSVAPHACNRLAVVGQELAAAHVIVPAAIVSVAVAAFAVGARVNAALMPVAALLAVACIRLFTSSWRDTAYVSLITAATHVAAGMIAAALPDRSWDGLVYHQDAILRLAAGWNPLYEDAAAYGRDNAIYVAHYPHAAWVLGASVLAFTGHIEAGKLFNLTLMVAAGAQVVAMLVRVTTMRNASAIAVAVLVACNPVSLYQATTFYVDGALASGLTVVVAALVLYVFAPHSAPLAVAGIAACLVINLKLTGPLYVVALLTTASAAVWWRHGLGPTRRLVACSTATGIVGGLLLGFSPYVRNGWEKGNPFYPVIGAPQFVDPGAFRPMNLNGANRVERFLVSMFSQSEPVRAPQSTRLKVPLWIAAVERRGVYGADLESGGFGPLYGGMLLIAAASAVALLARPATRTIGMLALAIVGAILASVFVHSETWWARYVPQAWLVPLTMATACLIAPASFARRLGVMVVALATVNVLVIAAHVGRQQLLYTWATRHALEQMRAAPQPIRVYFGGFYPLARRLHEAGVTFRVVERVGDVPPVRHPIPVAGGRAVWFE